MSEDGEKRGEGEGPGNRPWGLVLLCVVVALAGCWLLVTGDAQMPGSRSSYGGDLANRIAGGAMMLFGGLGAWILGRAS